MLKRYDPLEEMADRMLLQAESGSRKHVEYPCYSEEYLVTKITSHEDRWADPPEVESESLSEIHSLAISELVRYGEEVASTPKQALVWWLHCHQFTLSEIAEAIKGEGGQTVSRAAVHQMIAKVRERVEGRAGADRYHGWYIVYLETVTGRRLYES